MKRLTLSFSLIAFAVLAFTGMASASPEISSFDLDEELGDSTAYDMPSEVVNGDEILIGTTEGVHHVDSEGDVISQITNSEDIRKVFEDDGDITIIYDSDQYMVKNFDGEELDSGELSVSWVSNPAEVVGDYVNIWSDGTLYRYNLDLEVEWSSTEADEDSNFIGQAGDYILLADDDSSTYADDLTKIDVSDGSVADEYTPGYEFRNSEFFALHEKGVFGIVHRDEERVKVKDTDFNNVEDLDIPRIDVEETTGDEAWLFSSTSDELVHVDENLNLDTLASVETLERLVYGENNLFELRETDGVRYSYFTLPESDEVTDESTDLTGSFALSTTAGAYSGLKGVSAAVGGLAAYEFGLRDWLFGTNDSDEELWLDDIRSNAVTLEDQRANILSASELSNDALFGDAMAEARAAGVQEFNNGTDRDEAKNVVESTVEDYYSDVERIVVNGYNNEVLNLQDDMDNAESIDMSFGEPFKSDFEDAAIVNETYTLPNGEEIETYDVIRDDGTKIMTLESDEGVGLETESTEDHESSVYVTGNEHYEFIQDVRDTRSDAISNVNEIIDNIYDNNEEGDIEVSEELSALELVEALSTDYGDTGSYDFAAALLARSGEPTDLDSAFNVTFNGEDMEGALFASEAVTGEEVEAGETYDGAEGNAVFVNQMEDEAELVELNDEFTVNSITSLDDGSDLGNTTLQTNSAYEQEVTDLQSEIDELQQSFDDGVLSGPSGLAFGGMSNTVIAALVLVILGAFLA